MLSFNKTQELLSKETSNELTKLLGKYFFLQKTIIQNDYHLRKGLSNLKKGPSIWTSNRGHSFNGSETGIVNKTSVSRFSSAPTYNASVENHIKQARGLFDEYDDHYNSDHDHDHNNNHNNHNNHHDLNHTAFKKLDETQVVSKVMAEADAILDCLIQLSFLHDASNISILLSLGYLKYLKSLYSIIRQWKNVAVLYWILRPVVSHPNDLTMRAHHEHEEATTEGEQNHLATLTADSKESIHPHHTKKTIMISYCWQDKHTVLLLRDHLKSKHFKIWIDADNMQGDIIDSMSHAVESSIVVIACISSAYHRSGCCRQELTYANHLKKEIIPVLLGGEHETNPSSLLTGWLGMVLCSKLYYNLGYKLSHMNMVEQLTQRLNELIPTFNAKGEMIEHVEKHVHFQTSSSTSEGEESISTTVVEIVVEKPLFEKNIEELEDWLLKEGFDAKVIEAFRVEQMCGRSLKILKNKIIESKFPMIGQNSLMEVLQNKFPLTFGDALRLIDLISESS
jgi:hypothetical protein